MGGDEVSSASGDPRIPVDLIRTLLGEMRRRLGLDTAWLSTFGDELQVFEVFDGDPGALGLSCGDTTPLQGSYCVRVIDGRLPAVIPDTTANKTTAALPITGELGLGAYVGVPVLGAGGKTVGMVCAVSTQARADLVDIDLRIIERVAGLISVLIESPEQGDETMAGQRSAIRRVVAERDFEVVFQAIHDVQTGRVMGVEALARFSCEPFRPDAFLEQAAALGLDTELEMAILARVLSLVPQLPDGVFVSVNLSPAAVLQIPWGELPFDIDPSRIVLEITEHDAVQNYGALEEVLEACRVNGMRVAVDDVGAGFSSFSHVLELDPDFVKIDKSIIRHIHSDDARRRLGQAIAEFAGQIGAIVIAEGVETQGELDAVGAAGISWAQGYYLSRPTSHRHGFATADATSAPADARDGAFDVLGERRFELALSYSPIGMAVVGLDGRFLRTNRALRAMLGYSRIEMAVLTFQDITHPDDLDANSALLEECLDGRRRSYRIDKRYIAADGRVVWTALTVVLVRGHQNRPRCFVSQIMDVTEDRLREAELVRRAETDPLTAIANRSSARSRLEQLDAAGNGYGVLFCDIERFKAFNDWHGHHVGDLVLVEVAERLLATAGEDELVARWGGDEFLVVTSAVEDHGLAQLANRITGQFDRAPIVLADGTRLPVTLTVGFAAHRRGDGRSIDAVLELADVAMYERRRRSTASGQR